MAEIRVRNIDENIKFLLKDRAQQEGLTLEKLVEKVLTEAALANRRRMAAEAKAMSDALFKKYGMFEDSTPGIRAERDAM